ncbi:hypothetical protein C8R45DRAFT_1109220 [Mycena sanguinolenta]|nr:hypothetical protein C8R45DRAFT_1109220 [Mycena sanguinolenta]
MPCTQRLRGRDRVHLEPAILDLSPSRTPLRDRAEVMPCLQSIHLRFAYPPSLSGAVRASAVAGSTTSTTVAPAAELLHAPLAPDAMAASISTATSFTVLSTGFAVSPQIACILGLSSSFPLPCPSPPSTAYALAACFSSVDVAQLFPFLDDRDFRPGTVGSSAAEIQRSECRRGRFAPALPAPPSTRRGVPGAGARRIVRDRRQNDVDVP